MSLSAEEKKKFLKALEEDEEFKFAVAGLIGYKEILERIVELESGQKELKESVEGLKESVEGLKKGQEELESGQKELKESVEGLKESQEVLRRTVNVIAHRFGVISETSFREGLRHLLEEEFGVADVGRFVMEDDEGLVYGHPSEVEVDVLVKDGKHILVEVKSRVSKGDVAELHRIGELYERKIGIKPSLVIIGGLIDEGARELADKLDVRIIPIIDSSR
ncbi:MAG: DUF3782 domain-containing protein [Candidatus Korarchaeota archaeon]|nr:DUF3782 domain-containing protein [Candidatus Korarchaeota archaeon]